MQKKTGTGLANLLRALAVFGAMAVALSLSTTESSAKALSVLDVPAPEECNIDCEVCSVSTHEAPFDVGGGWTNGPHSDCEAGGSCWTHGCVPDMDYSISDAWESLRTTSADGLDELVAAHPKLFKFNAERQALQIVNCKDEVVAHVPVSAEVASALNH